jgi:hypothetical protein
MSRVMRLEVGGDEEQGGGRSGSWRMGKLGFLAFIWEMQNYYRATYRASENRVMPRAGTMGRSGGPGTTDLSCRAGTKLLIVPRAMLGP